MNISKKIKLLDFNLTKSLGDSFFGLYKSNFKGTGIDFLEHKEYNIGDPLKNIDWKASNRTQKTYVKIYEETRDLKVLFVIDINKNIDFGVFEKSKKDILEEVFFILSSSSNKSGDSIGALLYDGEENIFFPFKKGFGNIFKVISFLENKKNIKTFDENRTKKAISYLNKISLSNTLVFIISDDLNTDIEKDIKLLGFKNEIIYINIFDYFENNLSNSGLNLTLNLNNDFLNISLKDKSKIDSYKKIRYDKINRFGELLTKTGIKYKYLDTKMDIFKELLLFFKK
ncbi:MAG: DUF58 domain-containing protein [Candidatus Gracilibacteria bacterium]|nr:DUF58 domain-containing protein [Candidatus Gracilibacteria bacterium]